MKTLLIILLLASAGLASPKRTPKREPQREPQEMWISTVEPAPEPPWLMVATTYWKTKNEGLMVVLYGTVIYDTDWWRPLWFRVFR
jgi:hypothetical protein